MNIQTKVQKQSKKYKLVLDLMGTLIWIQNSKENNQIIIRPFAQNFIENMSNYFELILFSEEPIKFNEWILKVIDPLQHIKSSYSQKDCVKLNGCNVKDLKTIGMNLSNTIMIDDNIKNFHFQPQNGILIRKWTGEEDDRVLKSIQQILIKTQQNHFKNIQKALAEVKSKLG